MKPTLLLFLILGTALSTACTEELANSAQTNASSDTSDSASEVHETTGLPTRCPSPSYYSFGTSYEGITFEQYAEVLAGGHPYNAEDVIEHSGWDAYRNVEAPNADGMYFCYAWDEGSRAKWP